MRLTSILISNHARIPDIDVEIRGHLVLVGPNACGKTSVLHMLDLALSGTMGQLYAAIDATQIRDLADPMVVEVTLGDLSDSDRTVLVELAEVNAAGTNNPDRLRVRLSARVPPEDPAGLYIERVAVNGPNTKPLSRDAIGAIGWVYLSATRSPERELGAGRTSTIRSLLDSVALGDDQSEILDALEGLSDLFKSAKSLQELRSQLAGLMSALYPRKVELDDLVIGLPAADSDNPLTNVDLRLRDGSNTVSLTQQSDGLRALAVVAVHLYARTRAQIVGVDEPEIHLHPRAQAMLGQLLSRSKSQQVVSTHSSAVLAGFPPSDVLAFSAEGTRQLPSGALESDPMFLSRWWFDYPLEALTATTVVLVEGPSDLTLTTAVARIGELCELDRRGVCILNLNGKNNLADAYALFGKNGFGMRVMALIDMDAASSTASLLGVDQADLVGEGVFVCDADVEAEYVRALGHERVVDLLIASGLFSETQILNKAAVAGRGLLTSPLVAACCRGRKTQAAVAIALGITASEAQSLTPVADLLRTL